MISRYLAKHSPLLYLLLSFLYMLFSPSAYSVYLFLSLLIVLLSNQIFKYLIFKPLYNILNTNTLPILGLGSRPGNTSTSRNDSRSFGMPSGHSQLAFAITTYIILKMNNIDTNKKYNTYLKNSIIIMSIIVALYIAYSRIHIGCHTIQQVIVGSIIGIGFGYLVFYLENYIVNQISKIEYKKFIYNNNIITDN